MHCIEFRDISIFTDPRLLYDYVLDGKSYADRGEVLSPGTNFPNVVLTSCAVNDPSKAWSWQKGCVSSHLTKMCIYELKDIQGITSPINFTNIGAITLNSIRHFGATHMSLANHIAMVDAYSASTHSLPGVVDVGGGHLCSITTTTNGLFHIFDYEVGPSLGTGGVVDNWSITDAITGINGYLGANGVDLTGIESYVLKACLS
jgi:hypothetical protein